MASRSLERNKGFSLLEVIIAVAILSSGIVVILQAIAFSARVTAVSCDSVRAVFLAEDKLGELQFKACNKIIDKAHSESGQEGNFKWSYDLSEAADNQGLYRLDLKLSWQSSNRAEELEINTWLLKR